MDLSETKNLQTSYAPADLDEASRVLLRAADYIETNGFWKGENWEGGGYPAACAQLAIKYCGGADHHKEAAKRRLRAQIGGDIPKWNDAPERTQAEVVQKLISVALGERRG